MEYRIDKLRPGARYVFQIRSYNEEETSDWSPAFYVTIPSDTSIPANVGTVTATYTNQSFKFTWADVTTNADASPAYDIKNYEVTISDGTNSYTATTSDNEYIVTADDFLSRLGVGDTVSISVIAIDLSGNESATPSTANVSAPAPSDVTGFTADGSVGAIRLAWNRVTNVAIKEYEVYAGDSSGFTPDTATFTDRIAVTDNDSFVWTSGSGASATKYFKIRAVSIHSEYSANFVLANSTTVEVASEGLTVQDENSNVATDVTQIDFQGEGVTVTNGTGEVIVTIPGGGGSGGAPDPRVLFNDNCHVSTLPVGVSTTGDLTFNSTYLERRIGGTNTSTYDTPEFALNGTVLAVFEGRSISGHTGGNFSFAIMKGSSIVARITYQTDTNCVAYNSAGAARGNSSTHTVQNGQAFRFALSIDSAAFYCGASFTPITGGSNTVAADSQNTDFFSTNNWTSGLAGLTEGDNIFVRLETTGTRLVGISRLSVARGSESRAGGGAVEIFDEGSSLTTAAESINFTGSAVTATTSDAAVTVDIDNIIEYEFSYTGLVNSTYTGTHRRYVSKAGTLLEVRTGLGVAPTTSSVICDINKNGTTIFTTQGNRPTITTSNFTSGAVTNMDVTSLAAGDYLTVDIDQGDAGAAEDLTVYVRIRET